MTLYEILGVTRQATFDEIKSAYHTLAKKYHPDTNGNSTYAMDRMKEINMAYEILSDEKKRKEYDKTIYKSYKESVNREEKSSYQSKQKTETKESFTEHKKERTVWDEMNDYISLQIKSQG